LPKLIFTLPPNPFFPKGALPSAGTVASSIDYQASKVIGWQ